MNRILVITSLLLTCTTARGDMIYDRTAWENTVVNFQTETFNDYTTNTNFTENLGTFSLRDMGNLTSLINTGPDVRSTAIDSTPYALMKLTDRNSTRLTFNLPTNAFGMDLDLGTRVLCNPSKRHLLTTSHRWMYDDIWAYAVIYTEDPSGTAYRTRMNILKSRDSDFYGYIAPDGQSINYIDFHRADFGFCLPLGMDNVVLSGPSRSLTPPSVPEPGTFTGLAGLLAMSLAFVGIRRRRRRDAG